MTVTDTDIVSFDSSVTLEYAGSACPSCLALANKPATIIGSTGTFGVYADNAEMGWDMTVAFTSASAASGSGPAVTNGGLICASPAILTIGTNSTVAGPFTFTLARTGDGSSDGGTTDVAGSMCNACPGTQERCGGSCVDKTTSATNCGACGNVCAGGALCINGACACSGTQIACSGKCVDLTKNTTNCGLCGNACAGGASCINGVCACSGTQMTCSGKCVDLTTDKNNCGACGNACASGASCVGGTCTCPGTQMACDVTCVDQTTDRNNCGACGRVCPGPCSNASCLRVTSIVGRSSHTCTILSDGTARCWGENDYGQLGDGTTAVDRTKPVVVTGLSGVQSIVLGELHTCALLLDGTARCWGNNSDGQLGDGTTVFQSTKPVTVTGLSGVQSIALGFYYTCALLLDGTASCWGNNSWGELGAGPITNMPIPIAVTGLSGVQSIAIWTDNTCALLSDQTSRCWGANFDGQLGNSATIDQSAPVAVTGLSGVKSIAIGDDYACAVISDGTARCWGFNADGELGDGTTTNRTAPAMVTGLSGVKSIATGNYHACALLSDGTASCWGANDHGQLGDGTTTSRTTPVMVTGLAGVKSIAIGFDHSCALISDETLRCWGDNYYGQLGDGTTTVGSTTPVAVTGLSGVQSIAVGDYHICALLSDGTARCWGRNKYGQLGDGTTIDRTAPVAVLW